MFTVMKVREGLAHDDYVDPGPYKHPEGSVAREVKAAMGPPIEREPRAGAKSAG